MLTAIKGWRTIIVAGVLGTIDLLQVTDISPVIPPQYLPLWTAIHPFIFMYLRIITKGPVGT